MTSQPQPTALGDAVTLADAAAALDIEPGALRVLAGAHMLSAVTLAGALPGVQHVLVSEVERLDPTDHEHPLHAAVGLWTYLTKAEPQYSRERALGAGAPLWVRTGRRLSDWSFGIAVRAEPIPEWLITHQYTREATTLHRLGPLLANLRWSTRRLVIPAHGTRQLSFPSYLLPDWAVEHMHTLWAAPGTEGAPPPDPWMDRPS